MNVKTKEIYSEVYQVLNLLGNEYINKLPKSLFNMLKEKREINYNPQYVDDVPLDNQNIQKETIAIIALLYLNYWCESEEEKLEIKEILKNNEEKFQEELKEKYNPDNLFKNRKQQIEENIIENTTALIPYKESVFKKIMNKIKSIFHIKGK